MPWPDIFFKKRKPKPPPEPAAVLSAAAAEAEKKKEKDASREAAEKADSLRALTESGSTPATPRSVKESPLVGAPNPADVKTSRIEAPPMRFGGNETRASGVSLRQRAKLTDDALVPPKDDDTKPLPAAKPASDDASKKIDEPAPSEAKSTPAAVVPAAFSVPVETGSVLDKTADKKAEPSAVETKPEEPKSTEAKAPEAGSSTKSARESQPGRKETTDSTTTPPPHETTRVRLGDTTPGASSGAIEPAKPAADAGGKQEFVLANGERILGHVLSETPQTIYIDHGALGVLTLPRSQIAKKPIEVILINGDRIVGDLIAETPECMYIKHASLGMLTVPHDQRSTRVVEAIMKDGDRILGEVLAETENFTVIRSATLGTVAVQHDQVAMLNRKIEQMQLRALPPALGDKPKE
jgi:RNase P/RNase MRP subunit p29